MKTLKSIRLTMTEGSSDKEYRIHLVEVSNTECVVNFQNGRRNGTLTNKSKTPKKIEPLTVAEKQALVQFLGNDITIKTNSFI